MRATKPAIFNVSHKLADKAAERWCEQAMSSPGPRWHRRLSDGWKKGDWALARRAFDAGARWMLRPFQQVCGLDRGPSGKEWAAEWKRCKARYKSLDQPLYRALHDGWQWGRLFLERWIQSERFPS